MVSFAKIKVPTIGFLGVGSGITMGTLAAEWTSRSLKLVEWQACGVKAGVKAGVGLIAYGISSKISGRANWSFFAEMFAYGVFGSIFIDVALALYPGGIPGFADDLALTAQAFGAGGGTIVSELGKLEVGGEEQKVAATIF